MKKNIVRKLFLGVMFCLLTLHTAFCLPVCCLSVGAEQAVSKELSGKGLKATLSGDTVKVGSTVKVKCSLEDVIFSSSDTAIAYVDKKGVVTGKKAGTVTITVKKEGYTPAKLKLTVEKKKYKPNLVTLYDEIQIKNADIVEGKYQFQIQNKSKGKIRKIIFTFSSEFVTGQETRMNEQTGQQETVPVVSQKKVTVKTGKISPKTMSGFYECQAPSSGDKNDMKLVKVQIYAGSSLVTYTASNGKVKYGWGTKDKKAPEITGLVGANSHGNGEYYITLYKDMDFDFKKYVKAVDDRDGKVKIHVDTDDVDYSKPGIYTVVVTAEDKAGNEAEGKINVRVKKSGDAEKMADSVLKKLVKASWSDEKKARAIYSYVKKHVAYSFYSYSHDWEEEAVHGFRYGTGDCFTYYALCKVLLNRCGIPNLKIQRNTVNPTHYWNMVYVRGGWYHLDSCRRQVSCYLCLLTDDQLTAFSNYYKSVAGFYSNTWDHDKYPESAEKKITDSY